MKYKKDIGIQSVSTIRLFDSIPPQARLFIALACLFATSLSAASDRTNRETLPSKDTPSAHVGDSVSRNDQLEIDTVQPKVSECGFTTQSEAKAQPVENLLQNAAQNRHTFSCLSPVQTVYEEWSRDERLLLDVRRSEEFQQYQIPGSLNLKAFSIPSKQFLKNRRIALVNEGLYLSQLEALCVRLKDKGFQDVRVMAGGLQAWHREGYPLKGDRLALSRLNRLSAAELAASLYERDWVLIDLDHSLSELAKRLPVSGILEYHENKADFIAAVNQASRRFDQSLLTGFVVVSSQGQNYEEIERLLRLTDARNVFYLSGGVSEFKRFLNTQSTLLSRLAKGFKEKHRCSG